MTKEQIANEIKNLENERAMNNDREQYFNSQGNTQKVSYYQNYTQTINSKIAVLKLMYSK